MATTKIQISDGRGGGGAVFLVTVLIERVQAYRYLFGIVCYAVEALFVGALLVAISFVNCKMYSIARAARRGVTTGVSTSILAVACFVLFSAPLLIYFRPTFKCILAWFTPRCHIYCQSEC